MYYLYVNVVRNTCIPLRNYIYIKNKIMSIQNLGLKCCFSQHDVVLKMMYLVVTLVPYFQPHHQWSENRLLEHDAGSDMSIRHQNFQRRRLSDHTPPNKGEGGLDNVRSAQVPRCNVVYHRAWDACYVASETRSTQFNC